MPRPGFFQPGELAPRQASLSVIRQPGCAACGLYKTCISPKMPVYGKGRKKVLVIGEAPGRTEDEQGRPFVGESGQVLQTAFRKAGLELFQDCWVSNALICRPKGNELPKDPKKVIEHCRPNVLTLLRDLKPEVVILLGNAAVQSVIGWLWKEDAKGISRWGGWRIPSMRLNAWVCPTYHPSFVMRQKHKRRGQPCAEEALWQSHLDAACSLAGNGPPYDPSPPELERCVKRTLDPAEASVLIHRYIDAGRPVAFDYETDRLKPDHPDARIVCCAVSDGVTAVAYPWQGAARKATRDLLYSETPKLGWNIQFEQRWTERDLGNPVEWNNWLLDGMLAAHALDSRRGTKGLKYQAFARLGTESYDDAVKPYLKAESANLPNRVADISLDALLRYCGMDALLEAKLCKILGPQVGVKV
jgi:uracil-DNA glycosylase family 4